MSTGNVYNYSPIYTEVYSGNRNAGLKNKNIKT